MTDNYLFSDLGNTKMLTLSTLCVTGKLGCCDTQQVFSHLMWAMNLLAYILFLICLPFVLFNNNYHAMKQ